MSARPGSGDAVIEVLAAMRRFRPARIVRRFPHGAGGTSLVAIDGRRAVLKAWPPGSPVGDALPAAFERMRVMRARGCRFPRSSRRARWTGAGTSSTSTSTGGGRPG